MAVTSLPPCLVFDHLLEGNLLLKQLLLVCFFHILDFSSERQRGNWCRLTNRRESTGMTLVTFETLTSHPSLAKMEKGNTNDQNTSSSILSSRSSSKNCTSCSKSLSSSSSSTFNACDRIIFNLCRKSDLSRRNKRVLSRNSAETLLYLR